MNNLKLKDLKNKRIHFLGIGGISMSALAQMLLKEKIYVQGVDESNNDEVKKLKKRSIVIFSHHEISNLKNVDVVVYSSAIADNNIELNEAKKRNLIILKRAELLAIIAENYKIIISVAGSHGKTTATAMIAEILLNAGLKPTIHLGGVLNKIHSNYMIGNKKFFITESCEYKDNFLFLHPDLSVILNIDADHLDYFKTIEGVKNSFFQFSKNTKNGGINLVCCDDFNSKILLKSANNIQFGLNNGNIYAKNTKKDKDSKYSFDVIFQKYKLGNIKLNLFGKHNIYNALAAVFVGLMCGVDFDIIKDSLENFSGVERRFQFICEINGVKIYHDYAHHPKQIKEVVRVGKDLISNKNSKLFVVYEPHTYSRTKYLLSEFCESFSLVDNLILLPVYSARESEDMGLTSNDLFNECIKNNINATIAKSYEEAQEKILKEIKCEDVVLILGAGSIENLAKSLKNTKDTLL